ncbi:hypothetical protein M0R72_18880 [Candidatus Pacearchaeota archaeon]|jgi:hypothetical protein|nr:hypothetical protein [Candidatus Pacearchaeota archaeon]
MKPPKIFASLDHNETARPRAAKIEQAVEADDRFFLGNPGDLPFDLRFAVAGHCSENCDKMKECDARMDVCRPFCCQYIDEKPFHVELKDFSDDANSDYLSSIISGHLYEQILAARERQEPVAVVVLGDDNDVGAAIRKAASRAQGGHMVDPDKLMEYFRMVEGFEANCIALNIPVWRLKTDPYKRMLLRVRKILEGGDLSGFAPAPADGERQAVGLSILAGKGIGPAKARAILEKFDLGLTSKEVLTCLEDCRGIGPKLADQIRQHIDVEESV